MGSKSCANLTDVHPSPVYHNKVVLSNLGDCKSLKALLVKLDMSFLKELILASCSKFKILLEIGESMEHFMDAFFKGNKHKKTILITWTHSWACFFKLKGEQKSCSPFRFMDCIPSAFWILLVAQSFADIRDQKKLMLGETSCH